jgi:O-antigen/teichoic acid export membrane protein
MDQGLFAISNFTLNILLARWLTPLEYGTFGVVFAILLLIGNLHQGMIIEPMLVFTQGKYKENLPEYLGALVYGHMGFSVLASIILLAIGLSLALRGSSSLAETLIAAAVAVPFILLLWLMRRACFARFEPRLAASGGAWYMFLMLPGAYILYRFEWLSTATALGMMGASSLAVSLWLMVRLGVERPSLRKGDLFWGSVENHWKYGRWSVPNKGLTWASRNIFFLLVVTFGGLGVGASYKALMNLLMPWTQAATSLMALLLPTFARAREDSNFSSRIWLALILFVPASALYWLILGIFHDPIIALAYGGRYAEYAELLWLLAFVPVIGMVRDVLSQALRALERPDWLFWASVASTVVTGILGVLCVYLWGMVGAGIGLLLTNATTAVLVALLLMIHRRRSGNLAFVQGERESA